ncbi:hypothetical protein B7O34_01990 [Corynebacterium striatum]|nr:hypothetical protein [Corynebacterium striatum]NHX54167.1 hypothetical protein [Corynebacterium striatum]NHY38694.1 hypothetical protein [Corynebacterium striatum]
MPLQFGHAPSELTENSAGFTVLSGVELALAKALRMESSSPVYVAGLERREPLMGVWPREEHALCDVLRQTRQQRRLAQARNAGDGTEHAKRDVDVDPFMCFCRLSLSLERTEDCKRTMRPW